MTSLTRLLAQCALCVLAILVLWGSVAEAKRSAPRPQRMPCQRELNAICADANHSHAEKLHCLEKNIDNLDNGHCRTLILGLTQCRADLLAVAADEDMADSALSERANNLNCASAAFMGDLFALTACLREWNGNRTFYGADLLTPDCTESKFFAKATRPIKRPGGQRKPRGRVSGKKSKK